MEAFPWWSQAQKELAVDAEKTTNEILIPIAERCAWKRQFPWEAVSEMAKRGWFGALVPAKYGGREEEWGITGAAIILEQAGRAGEIGSPLGNTMYGGVHQIVHFGTDEQKQRWLPRIAKGEMLGSIVMTEPYAGSDVAGIETTAVRDGDFYVVNGKKRYQTNIGAAGRYMTYVRTSSSPEDRGKYRHLTALVIEKGMPGFGVEKINELMAFDGVYNGYLTFNDVKVPVANRIGEEGAGWPIMMRGLNAERVLNASKPLGMMREALRYTLQHLQRRVQFKQTTGEIETNQFKVADMVWRLYLARLMTFYAAYLADLGKEVAVEGALAKMFATDQGLEMATQAIQAMGGNGTTRFYPVERIMRDMKVSQIAAGTSEILKLLIYRMGLKNWAEDLKAPLRAIDEKLGVPMPVRNLSRKKAASEHDVLMVVAEDYRVNPGLCMTLDDIKGFLDISDADLVKYLTSLEKQELVSLFRDRKGGVALVRATYTGLNKAHKPDYYKYMPSWVDQGDMF